jgi:hypothetical protein
MSAHTGRQSSNQRDPIQEPEELGPRALSRWRVATGRASGDSNGNGSRDPGSSGAAGQVPAERWPRLAEQLVVSINGNSHLPFYL